MQTNMLTSILLLFSHLQGSVDEKDLMSALYWMSEDAALGWPDTFSLKKYCLTENQPYTMRIEFQKGETTRYVDCIRPYRVYKWYCIESQESCAEYNPQYP